ncbi:MAG: cupredoxin domain-containing protein [Chloroflexi bacterium]|nr:cupredoxin domain-containing protein [Chloroflexota bacterium]
MISGSYFKSPFGALTVVLLGAVFLTAACAAPPATPTTKPSPKGMAEKGLPDHLVAPHFVDSSPRHGQVFQQTPESIVINFNFNLHDKSSLTLTRDGAPVLISKITIDANRLALRALLGAGGGDGLYLVVYSACWPDGSCHGGQFAFQIDSKIASYVDMTSRSEASVAMQDLKFSPAQIVVSKGTKVTWTNKDTVSHFVNSDPHPSHNAFVDLNSQAIDQGQSYSFTFSQTGEWGYHCSAHFPLMTAQIVVR